MLTKEKSRQKRKSVNNQNNSSSYFRLLTQIKSISLPLIVDKLRINKNWSTKWGVLQSDIPLFITHEAITIESFPNPTSDKNFLRITIYEKSTVSIELFSVNGQVNKIFLEKSFESPGTYRFEFDLSVYSQGVYFYKIHINDRIYDQSVLKIE
jgi:hypothetical protein